MQRSTMKLSKQITRLACFIVLTMLSVSVTAEQQGPSETMLSFLSICRGFYTNVAQVIEDKLTGSKPVHDLIYGLLVPIDIPSFLPDYTFYMEEDVNNTAFRIHILVVKETAGGTITLTPYNITDASKYTAEMIDFGALKDLKRSNLHPREDCVSTFQQVDKTTFTGSWKNCRDKKFGHPAEYTMTFVCDAWLAKVEWGSPEETPNSVSYSYDRTNTRFPLTPNMMKGVNGNVDPCGDPYFVDKPDK